MRLRTVLTVLCTAVMVSGGLPASAEEPGPVRFPRLPGVPPDLGGDNYQKKPGKVGFGAGGSLFVTDLRWSNWGSSRTTGMGTAHAQSCDPTCAEGGYRLWRARLELSSIGKAGGVRQYLCWQLTYLSGPQRDEGFYHCQMLAPPPYPEPDAGSGKFGSRKPSRADRDFKRLMRRAADVGEGLGYTHAAANLRHYLDASGKPKDMKTSQMLRDLPELRQGIAAKLRFLDPKLRNKVLKKFRKAGDKQASEHFRTPWYGDVYNNRDENKDWFYATAGFYYQLSGYVTASPAPQPAGEPEVTMHYRISTYDRYNWDGGKKAKLGPIVISDKLMQELHETGLAREYDLRGSTPKMTRQVGTGGPVTIDPPAGNREGNRVDPGRQRG